MGRRKHGANIHGIVLLDKPVGISSNRAVQRVRGIFQARKAGHTGSLDPFATGMLPICLGEASKTAAFMLEAGKCYRATALLGVATSTGDVEGEVIQTCPVADIGSEGLVRILQQFVGDIKQVPPMYSALKHEGKPLYEYARAGIDIKRSSRSVTIHDLELVDWQSPRLTFDVHCSKGTYIRTLAEDIARALGSCAHLVELRRTVVEPFGDFPMVTLATLQEAKDSGGGLSAMLLPIDVGLASWPRVDLDSVKRDKFRHGQQLQVPDGGSDTGKVRVYGPDGDVLGLAEITPGGELKPSRVFNL